MADDPIPDDLTQAFREAVGCYIYRWTAASEIRDQEMIRVRGKFYSVAGVCRLVQSFRDPLPDDVLGELLDQLRTYWDLEQKLGEDRTYATAGTCLLLLMQRRIEAYQDRQR
jgi:hypothetical protein